jgi:hypothetical protein
MNVDRGNSHSDHPGASRDLPGTESDLMASNNELRNKVFGGGLTVAQDQTEAPEQTPAESEAPVTR